VRRLALTEHQRAAFPPLSAAAARALHATSAVRVSSTLSGTRTVLQARSIVGAVRVGSGQDCVELHVQPKVGVSRLLWLLGHARNQSGWRDDDVQLGTETGLVPAMAGMFASRCRRALAHGVQRGYQVREETLPALRGRLREADQMRARPGIPLPLEVRYDDYTADIPENRILRTAAIRLLILAAVPPGTRMALREIDRELAAAEPLPAGTRPPDIALTRLNSHYAPALHLARLILEHASIEHYPGIHGTTGYLFDMNHVYEDWLTQALTAALESRGGTVRRQKPLTLDEHGHVTMQTDITWWSGTRCLAVLDAKYKRLHTSGPRPEDLYQVLAYCTALGIRCGHLVYAAGGPPRTTVIRKAGIHIYAHVLPLGSSPANILTAIDTLAATVSALTRT
jgi:5-methylcytosine-specific restriction enzyme subunit McrC